VVRGDDQARVDVTGHASSVLPFLRLPVHGHAIGPIERFVPVEHEPQQPR
jgi:hypothetical protein